MSTANYMRLRAYRENLSQFLRSCQVLLQTPTISSSSLTAELQRLQNSRNDYQRCWLEFWESNPDPSNQVVLGEIQKHDTVMDIVPGIIIQMDTAISNAMMAPATSQTVNSSNTNTHLVRMPKLELVEFSGDPESWDSFWDIFF